MAAIIIKIATRRRIYFPYIFYRKIWHVIYLCNYLSTMFSICDVMIDREEIAMSFQFSVQVKENAYSPSLEICCLDKQTAYQFKLKLTPVPETPTPNSLHTNI